MRLQNSVIEENIFSMLWNLATLSDLAVNVRFDPQRAYMYIAMSTKFGDFMHNVISW